MHDTSNYDPAAFKDNILPIIVLFTVLVISIMASMSFPPYVINLLYSIKQLRHFNIDAGTYFPFASDFNILPFKLSYVSDQFRFKLYKDVLVYYTTLFAVAIIAIIAHFNAPMRRFLNHRLYFVNFSWINSAKYFKFGELLIFCVISFLIIFWACWWPSYLYTRQFNAQQTTENYSNLTIVARVFGQLATLSMSLMMFPVTRNSMWDSVFGVSYEQNLKFHRYMGTLSYVFSTMHGLIWSIKWAFQDIFWSNLFNFSSLAVANLDSPYDPLLGYNPYFHPVNFTIATADLAWILMTIMIFFALLSRRQNYEYFYYTHQLAIGVLINVIIHAWCSWFYLLPPILFYCLDKLLRMYRTQHAIPISVNYGCGDITRIMLPKLFNYQAGQFAWLNIPSISSTQWHPFTISSSPMDNVITFHIKNMGADTFTGNLSKQAPAIMDILIDGPYGRPPYFTKDVDTLVLIGGGVGITPLISILNDLYQKSQNNFTSNIDDSSYLIGSPLNKLTRVVLLWTVRSELLVAAFAEKLLAIKQHNLSDIFEIHIHISSTIMFANSSLFSDTKKSDVDSLLASVKVNRPNIPKFFESLNTHGPSTMVFACGPEPMVNEVADICKQYNFKLHTEEFNF